MRTKPHLARLTALLSLIFAAACGSGGSGPGDVRIVENPYEGLWQNADDIPFQFVLEQTFGAEEEPVEAILDQIRDVAVDAAGNVYILDSRQSSILAFDSNGSYLWTAGGNGEGPGELRSTRSLVWDGSTLLYVSNAVGRRVEIFTTDGEFVGSRDLEEVGIQRGVIVGFQTPGRMLMTTDVTDSVATVMHAVSMGETWQVSDLAAVNQTEDLDVEPPIFFRPEGGLVEDRIVFDHPGRYRFEVFDASGRHEATVSRAVDDFVRPGVRVSENSVAVAILSSLTIPLRVAGDYYLVHARWPEGIRDPDNWDTAGDITRFYSLDLFDSEWNLLYAWTIRDEIHDVVGTLYEADADGKLYARVPGDYPQVGRYRVEVREP